MQAGATLAVYREHFGAVAAAVLTTGDRLSS